MEFIIIAFLAGILTVAAPCILPLLPVIMGGSALQSGQDKKRELLHPTIIVLSLAASVVLFTFLLKFTTALLGVPTMVWAILSGGIVLLFGVTILFPVVWEKFMLVTGLHTLSNRLLAGSQKKQGITKDIMLGAALGPVFNSCSPTYALIVAAVLPASFAEGTLYLVAYAIGLATILFLIAIFGTALARKLRWLSNPRGTFKKVIGVLFIVVGLAVITGTDKRVETFILESGLYDPVSQIEQSLR